VLGVVLVVIDRNGGRRADTVAVLARHRLKGARNNKKSLAGWNNAA
jgi:hypothetical protein